MSAGKILTIEETIDRKGETPWRMTVGTTLMVGSGHTPSINHDIDIVRRHEDHMRDRASSRPRGYGISYERRLGMQGSNQRSAMTREFCRPRPCRVRTRSRASLRSLGSNWTNHRRLVQSTVWMR